MNVKIYVQIGMSAELHSVIDVWNDVQRTTCQRLANRMKAEVRAIQGKTVIGVFYPRRVECSEGC